MNDLEIKIGMGGTIIHWTDRTPVTVVATFRNNKEVTLQEDVSVRIDTNGASDSQQYEYVPDTSGTLYTATLRKDGQYKISKSNTVVVLGERCKYYDYNF